MTSWCDSLCCETFNPAAYDILHTSFFYATYGFHIACEYETKRLGIYNFSCLSRRGAIGLQGGSNDRSTGAERKIITFCFFSFFFLFSFIYSFIRVYCVLLCALTFSFCVISLCACTVSSSVCRLCDALSLANK